MSNGEPNTPKGFAGLDDLVSHMDTPPPDLATSSSDQSTEPVDSIHTQTSRSAPEVSGPSDPYQKSGPTGTEPAPSFIKWLVGGAIAFVVILVASNKDNQVSAPPPQYSATPSTTPAVPERVELLHESVPPVGKDLIFNFLQLRFCVGEKIRLQALEVFGPSNAKRFNSKVDFYNQRCSSYRYRVSDFESVTQDMRARRDLLAEQARVEWFKQDELDAKSKRSKTAPVKAVAAENLPLGKVDAPSPPQSQQQFSAQPAAPTYRPPPPIAQTPAQPPQIAAPSAPANGAPPNSQPDYTGKSWVCQSGFRRIGNECPPVQAPPNAQLDYSGHDWTCSAGYRRNRNECLAVQIPRNAQLDYSSHDWTCSAGYRRSGNECPPVQVPQNGQLDYSGHDWTCSAGFRRSGNECSPVQIPQNGQIDYSGHDWTCSAGYRRIGQQCAPA